MKFKYTAASIQTKDQKPATRDEVVDCLGRNLLGAVEQELMNRANNGTPVSNFWIGSPGFPEVIDVRVDSDSIAVYPAPITTGN